MRQEDSPSVLVQAGDVSALLLRLHGTMESTDIGVIVADPHGCILLYNDTFVRMWDLPPDVMQARDNVRAVECALSRLKDPEGFMRSWRALYHDSSPQSHDQFELKDGRVLERYVVPQTVEGQLVAMTAFYRDVTEQVREERQRRQREVELERSNAALQEFAYATSHDLQEPLRLISGYLRLVQRRSAASLDEEGRALIAQAGAAADRMGRLVQDLLALGRVGGGRVPAARVDLNETFDEACRNLAVSIRESGGHVDHDPLPTVQGHAPELMLLLQNLLANALRFRSAEPLRVSCRAHRCGRLWRISLQDNGIGIAPTDRRVIFGCFERLHPREYDGNGIGLALCRKVVERHGGRIWVESEAGQGATFHFTLPASSRSARQCVRMN